MASTVNEYGLVKIDFAKVQFCATEAPPDIRVLELHFKQSKGYLKLSFWDLSVDVEADCGLSDLNNVMKHFPFTEAVFRNLKVCFPKEYCLLSIMDKYRKDKEDESEIL